MKVLGRLVMTVGILLCIGGGVIAWEGWKEKKLAANSTANAVAVELAELEKGANPGNNHLKIGPHYAYYRDMAYTYEESTNHQQDPTSKVTVAFYPIVSPSHPAAKELDKAIKKYHTLKNVPEEELPPMNNFVMLVKTTKFKNVGEIERQESVVSADGIQGLLIHEVEPLSTDDKDLIHQRFPNLNLDKVLILQADRTPMDASKAIWMMIGGGVMLVIGVPITLGGLFLLFRTGW